MDQLQYVRPRAAMSAYYPAAAGRWHGYRGLWKPQRMAGPDKRLQEKSEPGTTGVNGYKGAWTGRRRLPGIQRKVKSVGQGTASTADCVPQIA